IKSLRSKQKLVSRNMAKTKASQLARQPRFTSLYSTITECKWKCRNEGGDGYIYTTGNASENENIVDLTQDDNGDDNSNLDESVESRSEYDEEDRSDESGNEYDDRNNNSENENENYNIWEENEDRVKKNLF
ncbi:3831_t:CDS:2, partial [Cetraspora pellucida]